MLRHRVCFARHRAAEKNPQAVLNKLGLPRVKREKKQAPSRRLFQLAASD
jgi:hypothetical protein